MASSNEAVAVMLRRSDGTQELVPISAASGSADEDKKVDEQSDDPEGHYVTMTEDNPQQHYTISSDDIGATHMVLSKELQDLVDVGYSGDQENTTVYVEVPGDFQGGEEVVMVGDQQEVLSARGNAQVEVRHHADYNDGVWSGLATLMEAAHSQEASKQDQSTDIQISVRAGAPDDIAPEDVEVEIVQHPDIGNEVEISNTDHNKAAQLTARIQNVLAQHSGAPLLEFVAAAGEIGDDDSDDTDYDNSEDDTTSSSDYDEETGGKRVKKRKSRRIYFPRVKARKVNMLEERRYKKRKFDPGPTMILQEEVSPLMDKGQKKIKLEVEQAIKDAEMDDNAMRVLQLEETEHGTVSKKTIYKCPKCPKFFEQRVAFKNHFISHSKIPGGHMSIRKYKCAICDFEKIHERWVNSHKKYHAGLCPFLCTECGCAFNAPYRLVSHHRKFHPGLFVYTCEKCMMKFRSQHEVNAHKMTYHQPAKKRYVCVQCGARFMEQKNLIEHRINHHKDYECLLCPEKKFKTVEELESHTAEEHTSEKLKEAIHEDRKRRKIKSETRETDVAVQSIQLPDMEGTSETELTETVTPETSTTETVTMDTSVASIIEDEVSATEESPAQVVTGRDVIVAPPVGSPAKLMSTPAVITPRRTPKELVMLSSRRSSMRKQYSPQAILKGMELFHSGYSIRGAAKVVGVPEATLRKKLKDYTPETENIPNRLAVHETPTTTKQESVVIDRRRIVVGEPSPGEVTQKVVVTTRAAQPQASEFVEIVPVQTKTEEEVEEEEEVETEEIGLEIVEEPSTAEDEHSPVREEPGKQRSGKKVTKTEFVVKTPPTAQKLVLPPKKQILRDSKKSVEVTAASSAGKKHTSPPAKKHTSPAAKSVHQTAQGFSPRRSSRSRKATEKGKNIFDLFESKDSTTGQTPEGQEEKEMEVDAVEETPPEVPEVTPPRTRRGKALVPDGDAGKVKDAAKPVEEKKLEKINTPTRSTRSKAKAGEAPEVKNVTEDHGTRSTRSKLKTVTKSVEIPEIEPDGEKEGKKGKLNEGEEQEVEEEVAQVEVRTTRSGRKVETPRRVETLRRVIKQVDEQKTEVEVTEAILCTNCGQISATEEESKAHELICAMTEIEIPNSPVTPVAQAEVSATKPDNIMFGLPDGSFVMVGESSEADVDKILNKVITVYQCGLCFEEFSVKGMLQQHVSNAHNHEQWSSPTGPTTCVRCSMEFATPDELVKHSMEKHKEFSCDKCARISTNETLHRIHMMWHEKKELGEKTLFQKGVKCAIKRRPAGAPPAAAAVGTPVQPSTTPANLAPAVTTMTASMTSGNILIQGDQEELQAWAQTAHLEQENPIQIKVIGRRCPECDKEFENVSALKRHYFRAHEKDLSKWPYQCALCKKAFATVSEMRKHNSVHLDLKPFQCAYCKKYFKREDHMKRHIQYKHENVKMFVCEDCGRPFIREDYLRNHMKTHRKKDDPPDVEKILTAGLFRCPVCGMFCPTADKLKIHQATHTDPVLGCDQCDMRFNSQYNLKLHYKMYHQGVQYKCQHCEKAFATQNSRLAHEREVHRGRNKTYKCRQCGKLCTKSRIKRHELAHRHQYKCPFPECERIFKMKKGCEEHYIREHTLEQQHVCEICDKNFLNNQHLLRHKESHKKLNRWKRKSQVYKPKFTEEKTEVEQLQVEETILYQCPMEGCEMLFQTQQMIEQHFMDSHRGEGTVEGVEPGQNAHVSAAEVLAAMQQN